MVKNFFKESSGYSKPYVHTPNGVVLSSYKFPDSGQYVISVKVLGLNFMPVNPKQVNFSTNVTHSNDKYLIQIAKWSSSIQSPYENRMNTNNHLSSLFSLKIFFKRRKLDLHGFKIVPVFDIHTIEGVNKGWYKYLPC